MTPEEQVVVEPFVGAAALLPAIRRLHERIRDEVVAASEQAAMEELARVDDDNSDGDTIYMVDRISEEILLEFFEYEIASHAPLVLVAEGIEAAPSCCLAARAKARPSGG